MVKIGPRLIRRFSTPREAPQDQGPPPKLALLIGINYSGAEPDSEYAPLRRAQADTKEFRELLISKYGYASDNIIMMLDEEGTPEDLVPTRANILYQIRKLVRGAQEGSRYVFFYSGHSGQVECPTMEEDDGFDEFLVPVDHARHTGADVKTTNKRMILDNELRKRLVDPLPVGAHLTAIFDSCHSGTLLDLDHYLCNNIYHPWRSPGLRRYKTLWQHVRRRDGREMTNADVRVIRKKHGNPDKDEGGSSAPPGRENSVCSVRIYQRKRVSEDEVEVFNTSVDVADSQDGRRRRFSVRSRRASVKPTLSLAQVAEGSLSPEDTEFGPRCSSPTSIQMCNGFCDVGERPAAGATVLSIASCGDSQLTWESKKSSFTQWLIELLKLDPHQPIGKFLHSLTYKMYEHSEKTHEFSQKRKLSWKQKHPSPAPGSGASSAVGSSGSAASTAVEAAHGRHEPGQHPLDALEFVNTSEPQLGGNSRIDLNQPIML